MVFTYMAVDAYGVAAEGNVLLATWMLLIGPTPALVGAKLLATCCGILLYIRGVHRTLAFLTVLYGGRRGPLDAPVFDDLSRHPAD